MSVTIFFCYAHEDEALLNKLKRHLWPLQRQGLIAVWHDRDISAGSEWEQEISQHLNAAHIILLLISHDFMYSEYCYSVEMKRALERHQRGEARVIPIILRPVLLHDEPFNKLQALPTNGRPVTQWSDRDAAFNNVAKGIKKVVNDFLIERWLKEGKAFREQGNYKEALAALEKAIQLDPNNAQAYYEKGIIIRDGPDRSPEKAWAGNYLEEALAALEKAIQLDPNNAQAYYEKGITLRRIGRYVEALAALEKAIQLDPNNAQAYYEKGNTIHRMELYSEILTVLDVTIQFDPGTIQPRYRRETILHRTRHSTAFKEALAALEKAIQLDPNNAYYHREMGHVLCELGKYKDALESYRHAIQLKPEDSNTYIGQGDALLGLNRFEEALRAYKKVTRLNSASKAAYLKMGLVYECLAQEAYDAANALENEPE